MEYNSIENLVTADDFSENVRLARQGEMSMVDTLRLANKPGLAKIQDMDFTEVIIGDKALKFLIRSPHLNNNTRIKLQPNRFAGMGIQDESLREMALRKDGAVTIGEVRQHFGIKTRGPKYDNKIDFPPKEGVLSEKPMHVRWVAAISREMIGR